MVYVKSIMYQIRTFLHLLILLSLLIFLYVMLNQNTNTLIRYLSNIVTIQPNFNGEIKDETTRLLSQARKKLYEKDLESALENLLLINDSEIFFKQWINEVNYIIEFEKNLNKLFG